MSMYGLILLCRINTVDGSNERERGGKQVEKRDLQTNYG